MSATLGLLVAKKEGDKFQAQAESAAAKSAENKDKNAVSSETDGLARLQFAVDKAVGKNAKSPPLINNANQQQLGNAVMAIEQMKQQNDPLMESANRTKKNTETTVVQRDADIAKKRRAANKAEALAISARATSASNRTRNAVKTKSSLKLGRL